MGSDEGCPAGDPAVSVQAIVQPGKASSRAPRPATRRAAPRRLSGKPGRSAGRPGAPAAHHAFDLIALPRSRAAGPFAFQPACRAPRAGTFES